MNTYFIFILVALIGIYLLELAVEILNLRGIQTQVPVEFKDLYEDEKYRKSQEYLRETTRFGILYRSYSLMLTLCFWLAGGFNWADHWARGFAYGEIGTGLIFAALLMSLSKLAHLPLSLYDTFGIEARYGFNKTTAATYAGDLVKGLILTAIIGGLIFAGIIWFFTALGPWAWLQAWLALTVFQLLLVFIAPAYIMPLFNKFEPLKEGELKKEIENFAAAQRFQLAGLFTMDGSKRSTKSNAFFTGFGKYRRIVLFDTLIEKHSTEELVAILAHEIGHYKLRHIVKSIILSTLVMGLMFYLFSLFINNPELFAAFKMESLSVYASLFFIGFLFSPFSKMLSLLTNYLSRKHEFEADSYAVKSYGKKQVLIDALKKLSVDNLSNLHPHPLKVWFDYTHPPVLNRIAAIKNVTI